MKIGNFGSFDPILKQKGIVGLTNASKLDEEVWNYYNSDWGTLAVDATEIMANYKGETLEKSVEIDMPDLPQGEDRWAIVKTRINQNFFRDTILASYNTKCAITGLNIPELLVASHIVPWSQDELNRTHPTNGICLNTLHDKAFDKGIITISTDYKIITSRYLNDFVENKAVLDNFLKLDNQPIILPSKFYPNKDFLAYHHDNIFIR